MLPKVERQGGSKGWLPIAALILVAVANLAVCLEFGPLKGKELAAPNAINSTGPQLQERILGGLEAAPGEFPFLVSIDGRCGGSIISPRHILTSAECVEDYTDGTYSVEEMDVFIGEHHDGIGRRQVFIWTVKVHEEYQTIWHSNVHLKLNNIAILKTTEDIQYNTKYFPWLSGRVEPIKPLYEQVATGERMMVVGWSPPQFCWYSNHCKTLLKLGVEKLSHEECRLQLSKFAIRSTDGTLCASPADSNTGTICHTDSGAPLVVKKEDGWRLVGMASLHTYPCYNAKVPSIYTQLSDYSEWILINQT